MEAIWILLLACWLTSEDVSCARLNETGEVSVNSSSEDAQSTEETSTKLTKQGENRLHVASYQQSDELCPCYPKGRAPVFQNLELNQFDVKRLVVYLYYSDTTKQLEIHIPNKAKQKLVPDIYEDGDVLEPSSSPCLINIIHKYVDLTEPSKEGDTYYRDTYFPGTHKHKVQPYHAQESNEWPEFDTMPHTKPNTHNRPIIRYKDVPIQNSYEIKKNIFLRPENQHKGTNSKIKHWHQAIAPKFPRIYNSFSDEDLPYIPSDTADSTQTDVPHSWNHPYRKQPYSVHPYSYHNEQNYNVPREHDTGKWIKGKHPAAFWEYPESPEQYKNKHYPDHYMYTWTDKLKPPRYHDDGGYFINGEIPEQIPRNEWYKKYSDGSQSLPFNIWVQRQIRKLHNPSKATADFEVHNVKYLIEKILLENGMTISPYGYITDRSGHRMNMDHLNLRPILIGRPLGLGNILKNRIDKLKFPNSSYFKAVLLTATNPMKILGTIPLGESYLPSGEFAYSGEANNKVHDYDAPTVPVYHLQDDYKVNMKHISMSPKTRGYRVNQGIYPMRLSLGKRNGVNSNLLGDVLHQGEHLPKLDVSLENVASQQELPDLSNQTRNYISQTPEITVSNYNQDYPYHGNYRTRDEHARQRVTIDPMSQTGAQYADSHMQPYETTNGGYYSAYKPKFELRQKHSGTHFQYTPSINIVTNTKRPNGVNRHTLGYESTNKKLYKSNEDLNDSAGFHPGFRIIGGNAATSSGAPLSNKGRSGIVNRSISA